MITYNHQINKVDSENEARNLRTTHTHTKWHNMPIGETAAPIAYRSLVRITHREYYIWNAAFKKLT